MVREDTTAKLATLPLRYTERQHIKPSYTKSNSSRILRPAIDIIPDRTLHGKIHTVSAAGLLNADYRVPSLDYGDLLQLCHILTRNMEEVYSLFRQMVFNVAIMNREPIIVKIKIHFDRLKHAQQYKIY